MKLKQKFIKDGAFKRYLLYALGEIILIVAGILIAVQINNANEARKEKMLEKEYVLKILADIRKDKTNLENIIQIQEDKLNTNVYFQSIVQEFNNRDKKEIDSIFVKILVDNITFFPVIGSYQSTLSNGGIRIFTNKDFISKIINLYDSYYKRLVYNGEVLDGKYFTLTDKYKHERRINGLEKLDDVLSLELADDFSWYQRSQEFYLDRCKETLDIIKEILPE